MRKFLLGMMLFALLVSIACAGDMNTIMNQDISWNKVVFKMPEWLKPKTEEGHIVYRFSNKSSKAYFKPSEMGNLTSQDIYNNLKQYGDKLAYVNKEAVTISNHNITLISYALPPEKDHDYEVKTYIFNDLRIRFITYGTKEDHQLFHEILSTVTLKE